MPVRDWLNEQDDAASGADDIQRMEQMDPGEKMRQARLLLRELLAATQQVGDALVHAGLSPGLWRDPDARLSELDQQEPSITLDTLLTRLTQFAAEIGPALLAGDGQALDDFERQVHDLGDVVRPLRALAQRERLKPRDKRNPKALWQALSDVRVGIALDRLTRVLRELDTLAPRLRPLSAEQWQALNVALAAEAAAAPARGQPSGALPGAAAFPDAAATVPSPFGGLPDAAATVPSAYPGIPNEAPSDPDAPTFLSSGWLPDARPNDPTIPIGPLPSGGRRPAAPLWVGQGPRKWGLVLATALLLLAGTATLTLFARPMLFGLSAVSTPTLTSAQSTLAAGQLAHAPTPTVTARPTSLPTTPAAPTRLTASPNPLPCHATGMTITNAGGQVADWTAIASGAMVSPTSGTLQPGESASLSVRIIARNGYVIIRWSSGSTKDTFRGCRA